MKRSASVPWQLPNRWNGAWPPYAFAILAGGLSGVAAWVALRQSVAWVGILLLVLSGAVAVLALNEVRRPLLAALAFSLPFHLDFYLGKYYTYVAQGSTAALGRITINDIILAILLLLWLGEMALGQQRRIELFPQVSVPAVLFIGLGICTITFAQDARASLFLASELIKGFVLFFYVANRVQDERDIRWVLAGLMAAVLFQSCLGLYQAIMQRPLGLVFLGESTMVRHQILASQMTVRPTGTLWHPNHLAMYLEMVLPVVGAVLLAPAIASHARHGISQRWRLAAMVVVIVGLATAIYTLSRGTWLSLGVAATVLVWWGMRRRVIARSYGVLGLMGMLVIAVLVNSLTGGAIMERLTGPDLGSAQSRIPLMRGALAVIADHPLLGSGLNNYATVIRSYDLSGEFTEFGLLPVVHNLYLLIAAELGLLGLGAFLWLLAALGSKGIRFLYRQPSSSLRTALVAGLLAGGLASLLHHLVDFGLLGEPQLTYTFWFLAGLLVALSNQ